MYSITGSTLSVLCTANCSRNYVEIQMIILVAHSFYTYIIHNEQILLETTQRIVETDYGSNDKHTLELYVV